jgi:hypothetical protein
MLTQECETVLKIIPELWFLDLLGVYEELKDVLKNRCVMFLCLLIVI